MRFFDKEDKNIGHNAPKDKFEEMKQYFHEMEKKVQDFIAAPVETEDAYNSGGILKTSIITLEREMDKGRLETTKPLRDKVAQYNDEFMELQNGLTDMKKSVIEHIKPFWLKKEAEREAEEERLARIADEEKRLAEKAAQEAESKAKEIHDRKSAAAFQKADAEARNREILAERAAKRALKMKPLNIGVIGNKMRKVVSYSAKITDWRKAMEFYGTSPQVRELVQRLANADARQGIAADGVEIVKEERFQ